MCRSGWLCILTAAATVTMSSAHAGSSTESTAAEIALQGEGHALPSCASCHGQAGGGIAAAGFPRLAGLPEQYLSAQLEAFTNGVRRSPVMEPVAKALSAQQRTQLARYYSALPAAQNTGNEAPEGVMVDRLALQGRWSEGIPACVKCHGQGESGVGSISPLAGQPSAYIAKQLRAWKAGARGGDPLGLMSAVAARLSEEDIRAMSDAASHLAPPGTAPASSGGADHPKFIPVERPIPNNDFGKVVEFGREIFEDTGKYANQYVGNDLRCGNCHLDAGWRVGSAPLWAAYVSYPAYRAKNHHVNTFAERLQGCFQYSMNGKAPPLGDPVLVALESYSYWMAQGAPLDPNIAGRGYPLPPKPPLPPDYARGAQVYARTCALCHGDTGEGQHANDGTPTFPALWGPNSFNWGAGMGSITNAASFIKSNMPFGLGGTLSDQDAWDVALYMDSHERPQDPRYTGSVAETRAKFHDSDDWMYGKSVNGHVLGSHSVAPGHRPPNRRTSHAHQGRAREIESPAIS